MTQENYSSIQLILERERPKKKSMFFSWNYKKELQSPLIIESTTLRSPDLDNDLKTRLPLVVSLHRKHSVMISANGA